MIPQIRWRLSFVLVTVLIAGMIVALPASSAEPAVPERLPETGDCIVDNIYYGATPPGGEQAPVLVFVHGLSGLAQDWWTAPTTAGQNDMYAQAYAAGYRTAFVNTNVNRNRPLNCNVRRRPGINVSDSGYVLSLQIESIVRRYDVGSVSLVAHSKGGLDAQSAIVDWGAWRYVRNLFTLSSPHQGSLLTDALWSPEGFWVSVLLGQRDDATASLRTEAVQEFRNRVDASTLDNQVQYFSAAGNYWQSEDTIYELTGEWLQNQPGGGDNDGVVTVASTSLPGAMPLFVEAWNHAEITLGRNSFPYIDAVLRTQPTATATSTAMVSATATATAIATATPTSGEPSSDHAALLPIVLHDQILNAARTTTVSPAQPIIGSNTILRGGQVGSGAMLGFPIEPRVHRVTLSMITTEQDVVATLVMPGGIAQPILARPTAGNGLLDGAFVSRTRIDRPEAGMWQVNLDGPADAGYLLIVQIDSSLRLELNLVPGQPVRLDDLIQLSAAGYDADGPLSIYDIEYQVEPAAPPESGLSFDTATSGPVSITVRGVTADGMQIERTFLRTLANK